MFKSARNPFIKELVMIWQPCLGLVYDKPPDLIQKGHFLRSGQADKVIAEAGLDGKSLFKGIVQYVKEEEVSVQPRRPWCNAFLTLC